VLRVNTFLLDHKCDPVNF